MEKKLKTEFLKYWETYFPGAELPIAFYYTDDEEVVKNIPKPKSSHCIISDLFKVPRGFNVYFDVDSTNCAGAKRYFGFKQTVRENFNYFLSCGIEGELEGERYKKTPEIVDQAMKHQLPIQAPGKYLVFKRFDYLDENEEPIAIIFFAAPDVLSGLFTLANFDEVDPNGVVSPFSSGCSSIVYAPYMQSLKDNPRAVLGVFDISARPFIKNNYLSFAIPYKKFIRMVANIPESFLITESWSKIQKRIASS